MHHQSPNATIHRRPNHIYNISDLTFSQARKLDEKPSCFCICVTYLHMKLAPEAQTARTQASSVRPWRSLSSCLFKVFFLSFSPGSFSVAWSDKVAEPTPPVNELRFWLCEHQSIIKPWTPTVDLLWLFPLSSNFFLKYTHPVIGTKIKFSPPQFNIH